MFALRSGLFEAIVSTFLACSESIHDMPTASDPPTAAQK
jgi:hypothetical protein